MSSRYDHRSVHLQKPIYLPIICRLSIKDIESNSQHKHPIRSLDEPSSPKVSCIGQVKRNNRITADQCKHKSRKPCPRESSFPSTIDGGARAGVSKSCRTTEREMLVNMPRRIKLTSGGINRDCATAVNVGDLDPPLPVVKRVGPPPVVGRDEVNLWSRRRLRGVELKSLQIKRLDLPNNRFQPPPTV